MSEDSISLSAPAPLSPLEATRELLGNDVILLPIPLRQKGPTFGGWNTTRIEEMSNPQYLARFTGNIGVLVGKASGNLCSIDVDSDDDFTAFLELNPMFRDTLQTRGSRGGNFWFRVTGDYPGLTKLKRVDGTDWGEFRATGGQTIIRGTHPDGMDWGSHADGQKFCPKVASPYWNRRRGQIHVGNNHRTHHRLAKCGRTSSRAHS
jgi:hypothetical protein